MAEVSKIRLNVALRELNISLDRAVEFLAQQNIEIEGRFDFGPPFSFPILFVSPACARCRFPRSHFLHARASES